MRNVTVTFADGSQHTYQNAPDDITPEDVTARAQQEFGQPVTALDGGRASPLLEDMQNATRIGARDAAKAVEYKPSVRVGPQGGDKVSTSTLSDLVAGSPKVTSRQEEVEQIARSRYDQQRKMNMVKDIPVLGPLTDYSNATMASVANTIGAGPRLVAGYRSLVNGTPYRDEFDVAEAENRLERGASTAGDVTGMVMGGAGLTGAGSAVTGRLAASGVPIIARAGNALERAATLRAGEWIPNTLKIIGVGAGTGALQSAGEGSDVKKGAIAGAVAAPLVVGGINLVRGAGSYIRNLTRPYSSNVDRAAQEIITEDPNIIRNRQEDLSARTGNNVPAIAALNDQDYQRVATRLLKESPEANAVAKQETANNIRGFMNRMISHVNRAGQSADAMNASVEDLVRLRRDTANEMMAPIENEVMDLSRLRLGDLEQELTDRIGGRITDLAPRVRMALRGTAEGGPVNVTVRELDDLRQALDGASKSTMNSNPGESMAYRNAAVAIRNFVNDAHPEFGAMVDEYARRSRMIEGFQTTAAGKRISDVKNPVLSDNLRTNEGRIGMRAGELFRQREAVARSPSSAINAARDYAAEGKLTRQANPLDPMAAQPGTVTENLNPTAAANLADASRVEYDTVQRMLQAGRINAADVPNEVLDSPETMIYGALTGGKAGFWRLAGRLAGTLPTNVSPGVSENLTRMLFSNNPAQTEQALRALERVGVTRQMVRGLMSTQIPTATSAIGAARQKTQQPEEPQPIPEDTQTAPGPQSYDDHLENLLQDQPPELAALASRVEQAESAGNQEARSSKGATGVMQVMPDTAPEAAQLAGVSFDKDLYENDPEYNRLLGTAYLMEMLRQFDGDVAHAVAAYNAGPNAVRKAIEKRGSRWLQALPDETQEYVQRVLG